MEPVDTNAPETVSKYYWVNSSSTSTMDADDCSFANSVCTPANQPSLASVLSWAQLDPGPSYDVYYKTTVTPTYGFRQSAPAITNIQDHGYQVYPNPTEDELTVTNTVTTNPPTAYNIIDVAGRAMLNGTLSPASPSGQKSNTTIDVSTLVPGTYVIRLYNNNTTIGNTLFVKN
jgi:hypothetical protein